MFRTTFRRLLALDDPPERTALAFQLGFHCLLAVPRPAYYPRYFGRVSFRFNKIAVYGGTFLNNPFLTLVPIIIASYAIGAFVLGRPLRIPDAGVALLRATPPDRRLLSPAVSRKLGHCLAFPDRRDAAVGDLFAHCLSGNIVAVAGPPAQ